MHSPLRTASRPIQQFLFLATVLLILVFLSSAQAQDSSTSNSSRSDQVLAVRGAKIYPISGPPIENGVLIVRGGKIEAVGPASSLTVPPNAKIIDASGKVLMPGIVDTHSHIGIYRQSSDTRQPGRQRDAPARCSRSCAPWMPSIPRRPAFAWPPPAASPRRTSCPAAATSSAARPLYVKLRGNTIEEMLIPGSIGGLKMANGENPKGYGRRDQAPMTRMEEAALARKEYTKAEEYKRKWDDYNKAVAAGNKDAKQPDRDLGMEALVQVLDGKRIVQHHSHRADDIMTLVRISEEFHYRVVVHHGSEAYQVANELAKQHIPVTLTIVDSPGGKEETIDIVDNGAAILEKAGVKLAINTDDPINNSRFLIRAAAMAVRGGMTEEGAMRALTLNAADMLDLGNRVGSLEKGKDADFIILSGPPFSVYTKVLQTWIEGQKVFDRSDPADLRYATGGYDVAGRYPNFHATEAGGAQ